MPSRKILAVLIVCLGVLAAVWILQENFNFGTNSSGKVGQAPAVSTSENATSSTNQSVDWQNILSNVQSSTTVADGLAGSGASGAVGDSLTDQLAQNFFNRYLDVQAQENQSGADTSNGLDTDTANQIAADTLSSGNYTSVQPVVYTLQNLIIASNSSQATVQNYINIFVKNSDQMSADEKQNGNEVDIINDAILNQDQNEIAKLDPIIQSYQTLLLNMLKAPSPANAAELHLGFVNSVSQVLADLQAIRTAFTDPVKALAAVNSYKQDYTDMGVAIEKLIIYMQTETKSFQQK
jgi:hypothetical protein